MMRPHLLCASANEFSEHGMRSSALQTPIVMPYIVRACIGMAYIVTAYIVMACIVMAYVVMACIVMAYILMVYLVMAYIVMAYLVMVCMVMACIVMRVSGTRRALRDPATTVACACRCVVECA